MLAIAPERAARASRRCASASARPYAVLGARHRRAASWWWTTAQLRQPARSTCRWTCCSASRRACCATCSRARAPRSAVRRGGRSTLRRGGRARAAPAGGRRQDLPDHHRRPHRDRPGRAATRWWARGRCRWPTPRSPPPASTRYTRRGDGDGRAHAARAARRGRRRRAWRWPRRSPTSPARADRAARRRQAVGQLDGRRRPPGRGRAPLRRGARGRASSCARRSASPSRWARTRMSMRTVWERRAASAQRGRAALADRHRVRAGAPTCAARSRPSCARRARRRRELLLRRPGRRPATAWAARRWRRCYGQLGDDAARPRRPGAAARLLRGRCRS